MTTRADLVTGLRAALTKHGHIMYRDIQTVTGFTDKMYVREFGSWRAALEEAGYCLLHGARLPKREPCLTCGKLPQGRLKHNRRFCSTVCSNKFRAKQKGLQPKQTREEYRNGLRAREEFLLTEAPFESLSTTWMRRRVIFEQRGHCAHCNLAEWRGKPLVLEVDHKNGNNNDYSRDNLEALCPNCHSQTPTWRGRNKAVHSEPLDYKKLELDVAKGMSISAALRSQGRVGKGNLHRKVSKQLQASRLKALQDSMDA